MGKRKERVFTYWENWAICSAQDGICRLTIEGKQEQKSKILDTQGHFRRISSGDIDYICSLIEESYFNFDDPILKYWLPIWEKRWGMLSARDRVAKDNIKKVSTALQIDTRGKTKPDDLKSIIENHIVFYRQVTEEKEKSGEALESILEGNSLCEKIRFHVGIEMRWKIYEAYKKIEDICIPVFKGNRDRFFLFLTTCKNNIEEPVCLVFTSEYLFAKGEVRNGEIKVSY